MIGGEGRIDPTARPGLMSLLITGPLSHLSIDCRHTQNRRYAFLEINSLMSIDHTDCSALGAGPVAGLFGFVSPFAAVWDLDVGCTNCPTDRQQEEGVSLLLISLPVQSPS